ncbi:MAG TPA: hypothetical protein VIA64_17725 [Burkholderiales bacterium]|jgi:hypothetical protein
MLPLPDPRPFSGLTRPALMAFFAAAAAVVAGIALLDREAGIASAAAAAFLLATLSGWAGSLARRDAIRDTATSTTNGAALGYVELVGTAETGAQPGLRSQIAKRPCVWYRYRIERRVAGSWVVESTESSEDCFLLRDATGDCVVDPEGAEIISHRQRRWREFGHRYHEQWIAPGDRLYVLGELGSVGAALDSPAELRQDVSAVLTDWKRDRAGLLRRFDRDGNGMLDEPEWDTARREAKTQVQQAWTARRSLGSVNVVRRPRDGRRYLISVYEPLQLTRRFSLWAWAHLALFLSGLGVILAALARI